MVYIEGIFVVDVYARMCKVGIIKQGNNQETKSWTDT